MSSFKGKRAGSERADRTFLRLVSRFRSISLKTRDRTGLCCCTSDPFQSIVYATHINLAKNCQTSDHQTARTGVFSPTISQGGQARLPVRALKLFSAMRPTGAPHPPLAMLSPAALSPAGFPVVSLLA